MNQKIKKGYKKCSACGREFKANLKNFHKDVATIDKLSPCCKNCQVLYAKNWRDNHNGYYNLYGQLKNKYLSNKVTLKGARRNLTILKNQYNIKSNGRSCFV